jgi:hypothetical protein
MTVDALFSPLLRIGSGNFVQQAYVVDDIDATIEHWVRTWGIGPFYVLRHAQWENLRYRGRPAVVDASFAMAQAGPIQIELCQQHNEGPSCYRDAFSRGQEGFHHVATVTQDYDAEIARLADAGFSIAMDGTFGEMRFAYVDTRAVGGFMTEVLSNWGPVNDSHKMVAEASIGWDGANAIREL